VGLRRRRALRRHILQAARSAAEENSSERNKLPISLNISTAAERENHLISLWHGSSIREKFLFEMSSLLSSQQALGICAHCGSAGSFLCAALIW